MNARRTAKIASLGLCLSLAAVGVAGCGGGGGSKGSVKQFCADYSAMASTSSAQALVADEKNGEVSLADPADNKAFRQIVDGMQKLAKDAPADIHAEAQLAAKSLKAMENGKSSADTDPGQAAGDHVDTYADDHCPGISSTVTTDDTTPTTQSADAFGDSSDGTSYTSGGSDGTSYTSGGSDSTSYNGDSSATDSTCDDVSLNSDC